MQVQAERRKGRGVEVRVISYPSIVLQTGHVFSEDLFGADDADWAIYRKIVCGPFSSSTHHIHYAKHSPSQNTTTVSSDEEEDLAQLHLIEQKLLSHDPTFTSQHTHASLSAKRSRLLEAFKPGYDEGDMEGEYFTN